MAALELPAALAARLLEGASALGQRIQKSLPRAPGSADDGHETINADGSRTVKIRSFGMLEKMMRRGT